MDNKKIYAAQVAPEYQESPLLMDWAVSGIIVMGNREYYSHTIPAYENLVNVYDCASYDWEARYDDVLSDDEILIDILNYYGFCPDGATCGDIYPSNDWWAKERLNGWRELFESDLEPGDDEFILRAMRLVTGKKWDAKTIRGNRQGEWQHVYYSVDEWNNTDIEHFEMEYFNTGTEWIVHDLETIPATVDDITGYSTYCYGWDIEEIRKEIAERAGGKPEDVVMYAFGGYAQAATYKEV